MAIMVDIRHAAMARQRCGVLKAVAGGPPAEACAVPSTARPVLRTVPASRPRADTPSSMVDLIYEAALRPALWRDVLARLAALVQADAGALVTWERASGVSHLVAQFGSDDAGPASLMDHPASAMPQAPAGPPWPVVFAASVALIAPPDGYAESVFCEAWPRPRSAADAMPPLAHRAGVASALLYLSGGADGDAAGRGQGRAVERLVPHVMRSLRMGLRLDRLAQEESALSATLSLLAAPILLVDGTGAILRVNNAAEALLAMAQGVKVINGQLRIRDAAADKALRQAVQRATADRSGPSHSGAVVVPRPDRRPLLLTVTPMPAPDPDATPVRAAATAIIAAVDLEQEEGANTDSLALAYGLSAAESRLLAAIATGEGIDAAATRLGVTRATAKSHLQHIFEKTCTSRQGELIRLATSTI